jgi:hypothetical protein
MRWVTPGPAVQTCSGCFWIADTLLYCEPACAAACCWEMAFFFCCPSVSFFSLPVLGYAGPTALFLSGDEDALFSAPTYSTSTSPLVLLLLHGASVEHLEREKVAAGICHLSHPTLCQFVRAGLHCDLCQVSSETLCAGARLLWY